MPGLRSLLPATLEGLSRRDKRLILLTVDAALVPLALLGAAGAAGADAPGHRVVAFAILLGGAVAAAMGLSRIKLNAFAGAARLRMAVAAGLTAMLVAGFGGAAGVPLPADVTAMFGLILFLGTVAARAAMRRLLVRIMRMGGRVTRVLVYGAGSTGVQLVAALQADAGVRVAAFVDDSLSLQGLTITGLRVYGSDRIGALARTLRVDRVLLAMPSLPADKVALIARRLRDLGLTVVQVPSFARLAGGGTALPTAAPLADRHLLGRPAVEATATGGAAAYTGRAVMVTGAGGSVGSELCRQVLAMRPARLVLLELSEAALYAIDRDLRAGDYGVDIVPLLGSVRDARLVRAVLRDHRVDVVLHAAAYKHVPLVEANPLAGLANNVLGTRVLAEAAAEGGVGRFVLVSSDKAVRPANIMGASKRAAELVVQDEARRSPGTAFAVVRFGNVLGSSGSVIPLFRDQIAQGGPVTLTDDLVTRYFMTIAEAARLVLLAGSFAGASPDGAEMPRCAVHVLDMGRPVRIRDLAVQMIAAAGLTLRDAANPGGDIEIAVTGLRPGEKLHEELVIGDDLRPTPHPKILRADEPGLSELRVAAMLRELRAAVAAGDAAAARAVVFDHVERPCDRQTAIAAE